MHFPALILGLAGLSAAAGTYEYQLQDATGNDIGFDVFQVPNVTSLRPGQGSKRDVLSPNWCGAVQMEPPSGDFTSVVGTFTVPNVSPPSDGSGVNGVYYLYQWVGIDGYYWTDSCDALIQAGTGFIIENDTVDSLFVWTEYYPDGVSGVNMSTSVGDVMTITVTTASTTAGVITIENRSSGQTLSVNVDGTGIGTLCGQTAEWIMENPYSGTEPFPNFSSMEFTDCSASTSTSATTGVDGSTVMDGGASSSSVRCDASITGNSEVDVAYTG